MTFTYNPSTGGTIVTRDKVRMLIGDTNTTSSSMQVFNDAELDMFSSDDVFLWAGKAMMAIASSASRLAVLIRSGGGDATVDRTKAAKECREQAQVFFQRSETEPCATEVALEDVTITQIQGMDDAEYDLETDLTDLNS